MNFISIKNYLKFYIVFLSIFVVFYLFFKHTAQTDSSISEWLINYQGGFTRRGLGGELLFKISSFFNLELRFSIFTIQTILHILYLYLFYKYFKNIKLNIIQIFALFTPIFLLYPVAEIEVLGRKEIILFTFYILLMTFSENKLSDNSANLLTFIFLPLICLIWELVILFIPFIVILIIFENKYENYQKVLKGTLIIFGPTILTVAFIFLNPLSKEGHSIMCNALLNEFGERCYMSANMLVTDTIYFDTFYIHQNANFVNYFRYFGIFMVGYFPLHYLVFKSEFISKDNFINKNFKLSTLFILLYLPSILLFMFGWDWGRWINILYTFSALFYFYLYKNNYINFNNNNNKILSYVVKKKYLLISIFIIFAFGWHPKATLSEDIGSLPGYRIPYKVFKFIPLIDRLDVFNN